MWGKLISSLYDSTLFNSLTITSKVDIRVVLYFCLPSAVVSATLA